MRAPDGHEIQVGDIVCCKHTLGGWRIPVHRVTKCYAFVRYNERAEGKVPRVYRDFGFSTVPRPQWDTRQIWIETAENKSQNVVVKA